jgi:hypothetical protein
MKRKELYGLILWCVSLIVICPVTSAVIEYRFDHSASWGSSLFKWFVFWAVGIRLFYKGIRLASSPQFTGFSLSRLRSRDSYAILLELGFANMALGTMGILSVINDQWRLIAAISAGVYYGLADMIYLVKRPMGQIELVKLLYNLIVFIGLFLYVVAL